MTRYHDDMRREEMEFRARTTLVDEATAPIRWERRFALAMRAGSIVVAFVLSVLVGAGHAWAGAILAALVVGLTFTLFRLPPELPPPPREDADQTGGARQAEAERKVTMGVMDLTATAIKNTLELIDTFERLNGQRMTAGNKATINEAINAWTRGITDLALGAAEIGDVDMDYIEKVCSICEEAGEATARCYTAGSPAASIRFDNALEGLRRLMDQQAALMKMVRAEMERDGVPHTALVDVRFHQKKRAPVV